MPIIIFMMHRYTALILIALILSSTVAYAQSAGLLFERDPQTQQLVNRQPRAAAVPTPAKPVNTREQFLTSLQNTYTAKEQPLQGAGTGTGEVKPYTGYANRTLEQAYFACRYEAVRAEPPGNPGRDPIRKIQIRQSIFEICINREGFFRKNRAPVIDLSMASFNDWWYGW